MTVELALRLTTHLLGFAVFLQALEFLALVRHPLTRTVWGDAHVMPELRRGLFSPKWFVHLIFSFRFLKGLGVMQALLAVALVFEPHLAVVVVLFLIHLCICIRFRGTLNGGSDMMTFVLLTGVGLALAISDPDLKKIGLFYIGVHVLYSYVRAGVSKLVQVEWRNGTALTATLSEFGTEKGRAWGLRLRARPPLAWALTMAALTFEIGILTVFISPGLGSLFAIFALVFHFLIYLTFGLHRFFWIWMAAWPALFFFAQEMRFLICSE